MEPTGITFRWSGSTDAQTETFPYHFFATEGKLAAQIHRVGEVSGRQTDAKCDVSVNGLLAELDYTPYPEFNRANGMSLGVTQLTFADEGRTKIALAKWKPQRRAEAVLPAAASQEAQYYRVMLGRKSVHAEQCFVGGFIGTDFEIEEDLTNKLGDDWREFNKRYIPIYLAKHPGKTKIGAGLACGFLWTVSQGIQKGDFVLSPDGTGRYRVGVVTGGYYYAPGEILFHRRPVSWTDTYVRREDMGESLRNSAGSIGTVSYLSRAGHHEELQKLVGLTPGPESLSAAVAEDPAVFALEKHLEDFLVQNWKHTELGKGYSLYEDENGTGQQYPTDTGPIDILAVSKDKKELLVVELKKGRASDAVVGQIQRYMGYVLDEIAVEDQKVRGMIVALEDDQRIRRALRVASNIDFYRYEVSFKLFKV